VNPVLALKGTVGAKSLNPTPYDADVYRQAIGAGVMVALVVFSVLCLVFLLW
jgi:hypothetical protein